MKGAMDKLAGCEWVEVDLEAEHEVPSEDKESIGKE